MLYGDIVYKLFILDKSVPLVKENNVDGLPIGRGVAVIGTGLKQHLVANYGQSNYGTQYVWSKAGNNFKPEVLPLSKVVEQYGWKMSDVRYLN